MTPEQPQEMDSSTDMATLHLDVPVQPVCVLDVLQMQLRNMIGMDEVAVGRPIGSFVRASLKGTVPVLNEAQTRLRRTLRRNACE